MAKKPKKIAGDHPLPIGSHCVIQSGNTVNQGRAKILSHEPGHHLYGVRRDLDKTKTFTHKVLPEHARD